MPTLTIASGTVTAAGAVAGVDVSAIPGDCTLALTVISLTAASGTPSARLQIEDSVNAFTASLPVALENVQGPIGNTAPVSFSWRRYQLPGLRAGAANAVLRLNVTELLGTTPSLTFLLQLIY